MLPDHKPTAKSIKAKYPKLFREPISFECQSGWYSLIDELCSKILPLLPDKNSEKMYVTQISEKYGSLRFYMSIYIDEIAEIIEDYERKSAKICEMCGDIGTLKCYSCWLSTLCDECKRKSKK